MKCNDVKNGLYFYITGEVESNKTTEIKNHLDICSNCKNLFNGFSETLEILNKTKVAIPQKNWNYFSGIILERINNKHIFGFLKPAVAVVISLLLFIFAYNYYQNRSQRISYSSEVDEEIVSYLSDFSIPELAELEKDILILENNDEEKLLDFDIPELS